MTASPCVVFGDGDGEWQDGSGTWRLTDVISAGQGMGQPTVLGQTGFGKLWQWVNGLFLLHVY